MWLQRFGLLLTAGRDGRVVDLLICWHIPPLGNAEGLLTCTLGLPKGSCSPHYFSSWHEQLAAAHEPGQRTLGSKGTWGV